MHTGAHVCMTSLDERIGTAGTELLAAISAQDYHRAGELLAAFRSRVDAALTGLDRTDPRSAEIAAAASAILFKARRMALAGRQHAWTELCRARALPAGYRGNGGRARNSIDLTG
jgi:hypothetical protein